MSWFDWLVIGFCWSLPFLVIALRHWRLRIYLVDKPPTAPGRPVSSNVPAGAGVTRVNQARDGSLRGISCEDFSNSNQQEVGGTPHV
jgi:hypothetical protein